MKKKSTVWLLIGAIVAGHAGHWFIGGNYHDYSTVRNLLVALQFILGMAMFLYGWKLDKSTQRKVQEG